MSPDHTPARRLPRPLRIVRARPRLFLAVLFGLVIGLALPSDWRPATRMLLGWDVGVLLYLLAVYQTLGRSDVATIRRRAALQDEGQTMILTLTVAAALASIGAIVVLIGTAKGGAREPLHLLLAAATILLSWALIHTIFALHYAHEYYGGDAHGSAAAPLVFPGDDKPNYWDFVYFSFCIGMTSQVSDVGVASKSIRHTITMHAIVSFFFNVALLALTINIAASLVSST
ncbi:MAG TPA: DUF1345 domain-containing protein [Pseudolabrys sp.]|nr:DUF1345 domain-containing protein [Pseudolabrys sp.]